MIKEKYLNAQVSGVDVDPKILNIAGKKVSDSTYEIELIEYDGITLSYEDKSFDKVLSSLVFHHLTRKQKIRALEEIYRVLKPEGELHIMDFGKARNTIMRIMFFPFQILDGIRNTHDNIKRRIPGYMKNAGFSSVVETGRIITVFGTLSFYKDKKPG